MILDKLLSKVSAKTCLKLAAGLILIGMLVGQVRADQPSDVVEPRHLRLDVVGTIQIDSIPVDAIQILNGLTEGDTVEVYINSPGGAVYGGKSNEVEADVAFSVPSFKNLFERSCGKLLTPHEIDSIMDGKDLYLGPSEVNKRLSGGK